MKRSAEPNSDKIKAEFRQKLEHFKATPSESLWDKIELSLDKEEAQVYKSRMRMYARLAAACLLLLIAFGAFLVQKKGYQIGLGNYESTLAEKSNATQAKPNLKEIKPEFKGEKPSETEKQVALNNAASQPEETPQRENKLPENIGRQEAKTVGFAAEKVKEFPGKAIAINSTKNTGTEAAKSAKTENSEGILAAAETEVSLISSNADLTTAKNSAPALLALEPTEKAAEQAQVAVSVNDNAMPPALPNAARNVVAKMRKSAPSRTSVAAENVNSSENTNSANSGTVATTKEKPGSSLAGIGKTDTLKTALATLPATDSLTENKPAKTEKKQIKKSRWSVGVTYAALSFKPGMQLANQFPADTMTGFIGSGNPGLEADYKSAVQEFNRQTTSAFSQATTILLSYQLNKNLVLQSGITYLQNRAQTNSSFLFRNPEPQSSSANIPNLQATGNVQTILETAAAQSFNETTSRIIKTEPFSVRYQYTYVGVPLNLRFELNRQAFTFFAAPGVSINRLVRAEISITDPTYRQKATPENCFANWLPAVQMQAGIGYSFSESWHLETALLANQFLQPLLKPSATAGTTQSKPVNLGASLGLHYNF